MGLSSCHVIVFSILLMSLFFVGLVIHTSREDENFCEMTYMFEYPQFVKIPFHRNITSQFPQYGLYAYGEGRQTARLRQMDFTGIPVVFIPGNSGSYKQVRSLASVTYRKYLDMYTKFSFDFFALDLNEEISGVYGGVLKKQSLYLGHCIKKLLELYGQNSNYRNRSFIFVGHSMGGMVAQAFFLQPEFDPQLVHMIINLATPHRAPVLAFDKYMVDFYHDVSEYWTSHRNTILKHISVVSVGGGDGDLLVPHRLTHFHEADINIVSNSVPTVWVPADHKCILWCKQLVLVLSRVLFDIVDPVTRLPSTDYRKVKSVLNYHLLGRSAGKRFHASSHVETVHLDEGASWMEFLPRQYIFNSSKIDVNSMVMTRLHEGPHYRMLFIKTVNLNTKDWIFACNAHVIHKNSRICSNATNLSRNGFFIPTNDYYRKGILLNMDALRFDEHTHVVVHLPPSKYSVEVQIDAFSNSSRTRVVNVSPWSMLQKNSLLVDSTESKSIYYRLKLSGLTSPWQVMDLHLIPSTCTRDPVNIVLRYGTSQNDWQYFHTSSSANFKATLKLLEPARGGILVELFLDPHCTYKIEMEGNLKGMLAQLSSIYFSHLLAYCLGFALLTMRSQYLRFATFATQDNGGNGDSVQQMFPSFVYCLSTDVAPLRVSVILVGIHLFLGYIKLPASFRTDFDILQESGLYFTLLPILLCLISYGLLYLLSIGTWGLVLFFGNTAHNIVVKFLTRTVGASGAVADIAVEGVSRFPMSLSLFLIYLASSTCGMLALCCGIFVYFVKLSKMYQEYLESILIRVVSPSSVEKSNEVLSKTNFHFSCAFLWSFTLIIYMPCLLFWARNISFSMQLSSDPSIYSSLVLSLCVSFLWSNSAPKQVVSTGSMKAFAAYFYLLAICTIFYSCVNLYRIGYFINLAFVGLLILHFLPSREPPQTTGDVTEAIKENIQGHCIQRAMEFISSKVFRR